MRISDKVKSPEISCIVLVGGKSIRLGRDKALEPFGIGNLLEMVLSRLSLFKSDIILVAGAGEKFDRLPVFPGLRTVADIYPDRGPLGGIFSGLSVSMTLYNLVVACDMPFLNIDLWRYMIQMAADYDIVVPRKGNYFEPLHAIYSRNCRVPIENLLKQGETHVSQKLFPLVRTKYIEDDEIVRFDPKRLSFFNINTEADLLRAKELLKTNPK